MRHLQELEKYYALRELLDARVEALWSLHESHMVCQAGCYHCCMDFSILPVEYHAIRNEIAGLPEGVPAADPTSPCPFLVGRRCTIYTSRPFICRTQGLPLLYMNDEQWELSACELNFTEFDLDSFTAENTFPQDRFNSRLFLVNKAFVESFPGHHYQQQELIPVRDLASGRSV